jgi:RNA polymerase sigma-70 factor (ECF subfamily)
MTMPEPIDPAASERHVLREFPASDELTCELVRRARNGDAAALDTIFTRALPRLRRWARGRIPPAARGELETCDLVQQVALRMVVRLADFDARHAGALDAYLRTSVINGIRDYVRRAARRPPPVQLSEHLRSLDPSPFEICRRSQGHRRYRRALAQLRVKDQQLVIAHAERDCSYEEIARTFKFRSTAAARMAVIRAINRLLIDLGRGASSRRSPAVDPPLCASSRRIA